MMASPEPFEFTKPDGTKVMARIYGDEFHSFIESLDGELLQGRRDAEILEEAAKMRQLRRAAQGAGDLSFPTVGSPRSLVLLVSFADLAFDQTQQNFQDLLTQSGYSHNGATGSCRDYYMASSDSIFQPQFDCFGPYTVSKEMAYYGGDKSETEHDTHAREMVAEVCRLAHDAGVDFRNYDTNNDGVLDNVFVFYAGHNQAEGAPANTIWPHASNISYMDIRLDGVLLASYACTSEYKSNSGKVRCGIGTFCHEFGHVIGQPDFYDTKYNYYTVGNWDIMSNGNYNNNGNTPPTFSAWERMYEGWLTPKQLEIPGHYALTDMPFHKEAFLLAAEPHNLSGSAPNPSEFFLLDNRSGDNGWDAYLPNTGMIIWHIDYSAAAWSNNTPNNGPTIMRMHLEEANGIGWKSRQRGEDGRVSDVYPGSLNVTSFNPILHNGSQLSQPIFNIKQNGSLITFTYISEGGSSLHADKEALDLTTTVSDKNKIVEWEPQFFSLLGSGLDPEMDIKLSTNLGSFVFFAGDEAPSMNSSQWVRSMTLHAEADSTIQQRIWVSFRPAKQNCEAVSAVLSITSSGASSAVALAGHAPRPIYVVTPTTLPTTDITPYSFVANWENQDDAEIYYLTLYQVEDGTTDFVQGFENFTSFANIREEGWTSNTNLTTTSAKAEGTRALYFKNYGDQITSQSYPAPVTKLSFWYNAFTTTVDTVGVLEMEAYNGENWTLLESIVMTNKTKRATSSYAFAESDNYIAFRLTWFDQGGAGIAFDAFTATVQKKITYLFKGFDLPKMAYNFNDECFHTFGNLKPSCLYYYQVLATDDYKGCEEHITDLSTPSPVYTLAGKPVDGKQLTIGYDSINYNPGQHMVYLTNPQPDDYLYFYNTAGELVQTVKVQKDVYGYPLDINRFITGDVYMIQHAVKGKLGRKNKWVKFIF